MHIRNNQSSESRFLQLFAYSLQDVGEKFTNLNSTNTLLMENQGLKSLSGEEETQHEVIELEWN